MKNNEINLNEKLTPPSVDHAENALTNETLSPVSSDEDEEPLLIIERVLDFYGGKVLITVFQEESIVTNIQKLNNREIQVELQRTSINFNILEILSYEKETTVILQRISITFTKLED
jgi:hypothetical protein